MALAVVIPAHNAESTLPQCLEALLGNAVDDLEVIVVDDASTDDTGETARSLGVKVVRRQVQGGPAVARNAGALATDAEVILFVDADVAVAKDAVSRATAAFSADPGLGALFGSYDASPLPGTLVSDYRNLLHHFIHQNARPDSESFWAGCGAVRRSVLLSLGGFDERYRRPSIEDIELGYRMSQAGCRIRVDADLQCTHLKRWTFLSMVQVDIRNRAYPWSRLLLARRSIPADLNVQLPHRASAVLVWVVSFSAVALPLSDARVWQVVFSLTVGAGAVSIVWLNWRFYRFLTNHRGPWFTVRAAWIHLLYYAYSSATFGWAWVQHRVASVFDGLRLRPMSRTRPHP